MSLGTWIRARRKFCCLKRVAKRTDFVRCEGLGGTEPMSQMSKMMIERLHRDAVSKTPTAIYYHQHETEKKKNRRLTTLFKTTTLNWASNTNYTLLFAMSIMKNYLSERQNHSFMSHKKALFQTLQRTKKNNLVTRVHSYPSLRSVREPGNEVAKKIWKSSPFLFIRASICINFVQLHLCKVLSGTHLSFTQFGGRSHVCTNWILINFVTQLR